MRIPTLEEPKELVRKWEETGPLLEQIRRETLKGKEYGWEEIDELLSFGDQANLPPRTASGLVEMQRLFMKAHGRGKTAD